MCVCGGGGGGLNTILMANFHKIALYKSTNCLAGMEDSLLLQCIITEKHSNQIYKLVKQEMFQCYTDAFDQGQCWREKVS